MADSNLVQSTFVMRDEMSPTLRQIQQALGAFAQQMQHDNTVLLQMAGGLSELQQQGRATAATTNQLTAALESMASATVKAAQAQAQASANSLAYKQQQDALKESIRKAKEEQDAAAKSAVNYGAILKQSLAVAGGLGIATSLGQIVSTVKQVATESVGAAIKAESLGAAFTAISGSARLAERDMAMVRATAERLGLDSLALAEGFKTIAAAARGTALEGQQTTQIFLAIAEAGRVLQLSSENMTGVLLALGQMMSKGTVQSEELRGQLGERLPGAFQIAARAMGVTTAELGKMLEKGEVVTADFLPKFAAQMRNEFGGSVEAASQTAGASMARFGNQVRDLQVALGQYFIPTLVKLAGTFNSVAKAITGASDSAQEWEKQRKLMQTTLPGTEAGGEGAQPLIPGAKERQVQLQILQQAQKDLESNRWGQSKEIVAQRLQDNKTAQDKIVAQQEEAIAKQKDLNRRVQEAEAPETNVVPGAARGKQVETTLKGVQGAIEQINRQQQLGLPIQDAINAKIKVYQKSLDDARKLLAEQPGTFEMLRGKMQPNIDAMQKQVTLLEGQAKALKNAEGAAARAGRAEESAAKKAEREGEAREKRAGKFLQSLQLELNQQTMTREEAEEAQLRMRVAAEGYSAAVEQQALALLKQAQAARTAKEAEKELADEQKKRIQEWAKSADLLGLELAPEVEKAMQAQDAYNKKLDDTLKLLRATRLERKETGLRSQAPGGVTTPEQEGKLKEITVLTKAEQDAKQIADITKDLSRSIEQTFASLWDSVFSGGITSAKEFGQSVLSSFQKLFSQIASQMMSLALKNLVGGAETDNKGGVGGMIAGIATKFITGLVGGAVGGGLTSGTLPTTEAAYTAQAAAGRFLGNAKGGILPALQSVPQVGFRMRGFAPLKLAAGGVVRQPSFALIGENVGHHEAVVPLPDNRSIPVSFTNGSQQQSQQPIIVQVMVEPKNVIDPRVFKSTPEEIVNVVARDVSTDGITRRVITQHTR